jgi:hypothetical protein
MEERLLTELLGDLWAGDPSNRVPPPHRSPPPPRGAAT